MRGSPVVPHRIPMSIRHEESRTRGRVPWVVPSLVLGLAALGWLLWAGGGRGRGASAPAVTPGLHAQSALDRRLRSPSVAVPEEPGNEPVRVAERAAPVATQAPLPAELRRLETLLASEDPRMRFEGLRLLAERDPIRAAVELVAYVEETGELERAVLQRLSAVALLGTLEGVAVDADLTRLYEGEEPGVRRAAALALARRGDESLLERELLSLAPDLGAADGGVRARATESAAALASPRTIPVLVPLLADPNSDVRAHAVDGLWQAGDPSVLAELAPLLEDPVPRVRERARRAVEALEHDAR